MKYKIKPVETWYAGVRFRSRLEARWAAMFDLLGWKWDYEPIDFNGWFPDFAIYGQAQRIYVEVKPIVEEDEELQERLAESGCHDEILIVGETVPIPGCIEPAVGWLSEVSALCNECDSPGCGCDTAVDHCFAVAPFGRWNAGRGQIGFCHSAHSFSDRISGGYDGGCHGRGVPVSSEEIHAAWREAGNRTQWRKRPC